MIANHASFQQAYWCEGILSGPINQDSVSINRKVGPINDNANSINHKRGPMNGKANSINHKRGLINDNAISINHKSSLINHRHQVLLNQGVECMIIGYMVKNKNSLSAWA
ncbi:hypothetical protein D1864_10245 [Oceanobacillus picturae]|nr:hypothetical protein D1864_10245 [Oceanobacillus picturae]